ncbi:phosphoribosyl-AMP cyclohydrolase [Ahrensia kielensis]|uniref:phosphoribosyl-AMP cyclohydrolase n=1 Tax=Ahrensia kielensis TaxID=76980 RepID=UPI00037FB44E
MSLPVSQIVFASADVSKQELDSGDLFRPRFNEAGLITAIAVDAEDNTILMVAYMNAEALQLSLQTGIAHYWSRSRNALWKKGETSGNVQIIAEIRTDCDQDVVMMRVRTQDSGANCHTGRKSCFYRSLEVADDGKVVLSFDEKDQPRFDPSKVYK